MSLRKFFGTVQDKYGNALSGASVTVRLAGTGTLATLYLDNEVTTQANPLTTNTQGEYEFKAADGEYDVTASASGVTTASLNVRLDPIASAAGKALMTAVDAAAQRTALGLGTASLADIATLTQINNRGEWTGPGTDYERYDAVEVSSIIYRCETAHTSGATFVGDSANWVIQAAAPVNVTNAQMANMAQATIKGRASGAGTGKPVDLTPSQARSAIGPYDDALVTAHGSSTGRTLKDHFADFINVADDGAVGGATDDSAAWNLAIARASTNQTIITPFAVNTLTSGVTLNKKVRIVGIGREQCEVSGNWTVTDAAVGACLEDMNLKDPTSALFTVTGRGGLDFKRCLMNPGSGKFVFAWNNSGTTPQAIELIQCHMNTGKLLDCSSGGVTTFSIHIKEASLVSFTEDDQLTTAAGNYAECLVYQSLVNVSAGLIRFATNLRGLITCRQSIIDDGSTARVFLTNGAGNDFDTADIADCLVMHTASGTRRFIPLPSSFSGNGLGANSPVKAAIGTGTLNLAGDDFNDYWVITGDVTQTGNVTYSVSGGLYEGQRKTAYFVDTHTCNGYTCNLFGLSHSAQTASVGPCKIDLIYVNGNWEVFASGRSRFIAQEKGTQPDVADTSGAALAALESSVNSLKGAIRAAGIMG